MTTNAWRQESETPSLSEVFRTIAVGNGGTSRFRRFLAFIGPGYLVAVVVILLLLPDARDASPTVWLANLTLTQIYVPDRKSVV